MKTFAPIVPVAIDPNSVVQKKISNIKIFRHATGCTLFNSKTYVDRRCEELQVEYLTDVQIGQLLRDYHAFIMANPQRAP